jgi:hypothetical protein
MTYSRRKGLASSIRGFTKAFDMFVATPELNNARARMVEAEMWVLRVPCTDDPDEPVPPESETT